MKSRSRSFLIPALIALAFGSSELLGAPLNPELVSLPISFEKNVGQAPAAYEFLSRHGSVEALFSQTGVDMVLPDLGGVRARIGFRLLGAQPDAFPQGHNQIPGVSNYLLGADSSRWIRGVLNYEQVLYRGIYPGIDLVFHGTGREIEHDFRIAPNADPNRLCFRIEAIRGLTLTSAGDLAISMPSGELVFRKPVAYQQSARGRESVTAAFVINADGSVHFRLGAYDRSRELVIDPVFSFSTYLAGSNYDQAFGLTTDSSGNVYVTGTTESLDFPIKDGVQTTNGGASAGFVSKLDPTGHTLLYSTYLGGSYGLTTAGLIALDSNENIVVAGISSSGDFPHVGSVPTTTCTGGNSCYFIVSLKPDGSAFNYAGLIGGSQAGIQLQEGQSIIASLFVDKTANVYLAGITDSSAFEITPGTLATTVPNYPYDSTFVLKANSTGALVYSTIIPGTYQKDDAGEFSNVFFPAGIYVDAQGQATIGGTAGVGLPSTPGVIQGTFPNPYIGNITAGFVLQLNADASAINYATYVPGTDTIGGFAVDSLGNSYVTGGTSETNLPVSSNAYQKALRTGNGCTCDGGFLLKLDAAGKNVLAATYLGGTPGPGSVATGFFGIALDSHSNVFVGGMSASTDFPLVNPFVDILESGDFNGDLVLAEMSPDLSSLLFGSFLSSTDQTLAASTFSAISVDSQDNLIVAGGTSTIDFPTTPGSFQPTPPAQGVHPFIAKLNMNTPAPAVCLDSWNVNFGSVLAKQSSTQVLHLTNCGNAPLSIDSLISSAATVTVKDACGTVKAGSICPITLTYRPADSSTTMGTLTITDNAVISPQRIEFSGQGVDPQLRPSSGSVDFGDLLVGTNGASNTLIFSNAGNAPLTITAVSVDGDFSITQNLCVTTLQPGFNSFCAIKVTFSPTTAGIRTGTLTVVSNDPVNPQAGISLVGMGDAAYAVPVITSLGSPTAQINNGTTTVQVYGANFYPASVIQVNGASQTTTYSDGGHLQAVINASVTGKIGELLVSVMNPGPGGGGSVAVPLTLFQAVSLGAAYLASVPGSQTIYASIPSSAAANPNTVIPINPATGALGKPIPVGHNPSLLAASSDGSYLFVVADQDQTVQRIKLSTQTVDRTFPFPPLNNNCCGMLSGTDLKGVPGSPQEVILALGVPDYGLGEMALYNDAGMVNYVPTAAVNSVAFSSFAFAGSPLTIYALPLTAAQKPFFNVITINSQGLQFTPYTGGNFGDNTTTGFQVVSDGTLLYTISGEIWSPLTQAQVGTFPVNLDNATSYPNLFDLLMDLPSKQLFSIGDQPYQIDSDAFTLAAYGQESHLLNGALAFPDLASVVEGQSLVRWGSNGFAFVGGGAVYLLTSSLAASVTSNPVPHLISVTPSSVTKNTPEFQITLNGQGFIQGSLVMWNKTTLPTTYVADSVLTALVPAADVANSGSASVTVVNPAPKGGSSNAISFTISALEPLISFSSPALTFPSQAVGTSSAAQEISIQNPGTANLVITGISVTGSDASSFHQTNTCGSGLAPGANCSVSVVFRPTVGGDQSASVTVVDNAQASPQSVALSGGVSLGLTAASGGSTSATVAAGGTATYSLTIGGQGIAGEAKITCSGAPKDAVCSVPASLELSATSRTPFTVTVATTSQTMAHSITNRMEWLWAVAVFGCVVMPGARTWRSALRRLGILPLMFLMLVCGCGGNSGSGNQPTPNGTPTGQYTLMVTASAGSSNQSLSLNLTVQ